MKAERSAASTWQRDAWEAFARWCEHGPYTDDREAPHAEAFVAGYEAGSATVELGPDRRDRGARFAPASASSASDKTPNTGSSGPSSAALPPHDHTIEPGEINRRGCRRCEIDREASAAQDRKLTDLVSLREHFELEVRVAHEQQTAMPEASEFWRGRAGAFEDALTDLAEWTRGNSG